MAYDCDFDFEGGVVRVVLSGAPGAAELAAMSEVAAARAAEHGCRRVLVDLRGLERLGPTVELYHPLTGLDGARSDRPDGALLIRPDQDAPTRILETMARNLGGSLVRCFTPVEADTWCAPAAAPGGAT